MYSVENPAGDTFFKDKISLATKPEAFSTDIVVAVGGYVPAGNAADDVNVVEFATYNCPPTALTVSFSNTAVDISNILPPFLDAELKKNVPQLENEAPLTLEFVVGSTLIVVGKFTFQLATQPTE